MRKPKWEERPLAYSILPTLDKKVVEKVVIREVIREVKLPPDPNPRCSCKCGCDRKMLPEDKYRRTCDPCALGVHKDEE